MKLVLFAIIAFNFANFGEAQLIPDYCECAFLWIQNTVDYMGLSNSTCTSLTTYLVNNSTPSKILTGLIYQTWGQTSVATGRDVGCPCDIDCLKNMFNVGHSIITFDS